MNTSATNRRLRLLLTSIARGTLEPQPDFQRRLVWSNKDKVEFIKTVLEGYPFPEIYIASGNVDPKTGEGTELLVDGQQRITTLFQYFKDSRDLKLPKDVLSYKNLSEQQQLEFLEYEVVVRDLGNKPIEDIKEIFQRINSTSYGLNTMEIHNARYGGEFKKFAETMSEHKFFEDKRIFNNTDLKRMNDVRYCLGIIVTLMSNYFTREKEIEVFLERYNELFEDKDRYLEELNQIFLLIDQMNFPQNSRAYQKADFFTLFVELYKAKFRHNKEIDISLCREQIENFYNKVEGVSSGNVVDPDADRYYKAALQASNDRSSRTTRGEIIQALLV